LDLTFFSSPWGCPSSLPRQGFLSVLHAGPPWKDSCFSGFFFALETLPRVFSFFFLPPLQSWVAGPPSTTYDGASPIFFPPSLVLVYGRSDFFWPGSCVFLFGAAVFFTPPPRTGNLPLFFDFSHPSRCDAREESLLLWSKGLRCTACLWDLPL